MFKKTTFFRPLSLKPVWASRKINKVLKKTVLVTGFIRPIERF